MWENSQSIVFLRKIIPWWIKKSYGIEVAWLAWIPKEILSQAQKTLFDLYKQNSFQQLSIEQATDVNEFPEAKDNDEIEKYRKLLENFNSLNINNITDPITINFVGIKIGDANGNASTN